MNSQTSSPDIQADHEPTERRITAKRPKAIVAIVVLFFAFSIEQVANLVLAGENWWIVYLGVTVLLAFWFRKLWRGDERERKIAVFFGYFCAAASIFAASDEPFRTWPHQEYIDLIEGAYYFLAATYLVWARKNPFFTSAGQAS